MYLQWRGSEYEEFIFIGCSDSRVAHTIKCNEYKPLDYLMAMIIQPFCKIVQS